jgi:hypothetical protein
MKDLHEYVNPITGKKSSFISGWCYEGN